MKSKVLIFIVLFSNQIKAQIIQSQDSIKIIDKTCFSKKDQNILMIREPNSNKIWVEMKAIQGQYDYSKDQPEPEIKYSIHYLSSKDSFQVPTDHLGTRYFGLLLRSEVNQEKTTTNPVDFPEIYQFAIRKDDSYLGYLSEMIHVPFVLPPKYYDRYKHETDDRIGTDCAELAIYGKRRMGKKIPYVGPFEIDKFLQKIPNDSLFAGCVLHFGFQVSVLWEDVNKNQSLDPEDLLIQALDYPVQITSFKSSGYYGASFRAFRWND